MPRALSPVRDAHDTPGAPSAGCVERPCTAAVRHKRWPPGRGTRHGGRAWARPGAGGRALRPGWPAACPGGRRGPARGRLTPRPLRPARRPAAVCPAVVPPQAAWPSGRQRGARDAGARRLTGRRSALGPGASGPRPGGRRPCGPSATPPEPEGGRPGVRRAQRWAPTAAPGTADGGRARRRCGRAR